jgi:hypothetical protein
VTTGQQTEDKCMNLGHGQKRGGGAPEEGPPEKDDRTERQQEVVWQEQRKEMNHSSETNKENVKHDIIFPCTKKRNSQPDTIKMQTLPSDYVRGKFF